MLAPADVVAVDLGASSGRVMLGHAGADVLDLTEVHRFANRPVEVAGTLHWDVLALYAGAVDGIRAAARSVATLARRRRGLLGGRLRAARRARAAARQPRPLPRPRAPTG